MKDFVFSLKGLAQWPFIISNVLLLAVCLTGVLKFTRPLSATHAAGASSPKTFTGGCRSGLQDTWTPADGVFFQGRTDKKEVALTFDDGPFGTLQSTHNTRTVLNILEKNKIHATFFVVGE